MSSQPRDRFLVQGRSDGHVLTLVGCCFPCLQILQDKGISETS